MNDMTAPAALAAAFELDDARRTRCEVWTRVMGYHRPVSSFNAGKKGEHHERRFFVEKSFTDKP
jgi:hypothetical protein